MGSYSSSFVLGYSDVVRLEEQGDMVSKEGLDGLIGGSR